MRARARFLPCLPLALLLAGCAAGNAAPPPASPSGGPRLAQQEAAQSHDPVAAKLALWLRAQAPSPPAGDMSGAVSAAEIDSFLRTNPDWPARPALRARLQAALAIEPDDTVARALCAADRPNIVGSLLRCQSLLPAAAFRDDAAAAWIAGIDDADDEAQFVSRLGAMPTAAEQWRRFDRQDWSGANAAARREIARLAPADQALARARLSLRDGSPGAGAIVAGLRGTGADDPALLLDLARWQRKQGHDDAALELWRERGFAAESAVGASHRAAFWAERSALAREMLTQRRDAEALLLADDSAQTEPAAVLDSAFLSGWISLRRLGEADRAAAFFTELTKSRSVITSSRGFFWLGQALMAQPGQAGAAREAYLRAAALPTSFYGQAAIRLLSPNDAAALAIAIDQARDPGWSQDDAIRFAGLELAHAASLLVAWNDPHDARLFLRRLDEMADNDRADARGSDRADARASDRAGARGSDRAGARGSDRAHALGAALADQLGLPDVAVAIARSAGRHGLVLAQSGWPAPYAPPKLPPLPPGLALAVMRQESSFDPLVVSPVGAHGLMQLMAGTARTVAGGSVDVAQLSEPRANMALGTRYLASLLEEFGGSVPVALAAYNAGPNRAMQWLAQNGTPSGMTADASVIDWIELIPFPETRNYVQRVMESQTLYRIRDGGLDQSPPDLSPHELTPLAWQAAR